MGRVEMLARGRWHRPPPSRRGTRVVAIGSTGVAAGQSTIAAHLAMAMANLGAQVIAVDLDDRSPTLTRWLGVEPPRLGWRALVDQQIATLDLALTRSPVRNLQVLCPGAARAGAATGTGGLDAAARALLVQQLRSLGADVVILDLGRTTRDDLAAWFALTEVGLLVTSPARPSLATALELIGALAQQPGPESAVPAADADTDLLVLGTRLVGNLASGPEDVEVLHAFSRLVRDELSIDLPVLGCLFTHDRLASAESPRQTLPGQIAFDANAQAFLRMGEILLHEDLSVPDTDAEHGDAAATPASSGSAAAPAPDAIATRRLGDAQQILTTQLDRHRRKQVRVEVAWAATLIVGTRPVAVRVVDVSLSGAALEVVSPLPLGTTGTLVFDQLVRQPAVRVVVKSLRPEVGRAGVAFVGADDLREALVSAAREQQAPAPFGESDEEPTRPLRVPSGG